MKNRPGMTTSVQAHRDKHRVVFGHSHRSSGTCGEYLRWNVQRHSAPISTDVAVDGSLRATVDGPGGGCNFEVVLKQR
jgi:hypothetical protein